MSTESSSGEEQNEQTDAASFDVEGFKQDLKEARRVIVMAVTVDDGIVGIECNFKSAQSGAAIPKRYQQVRVS